MQTLSQSRHSYSEAHQIARAHFCLKVQIDRKITMDYDYFWRNIQQEFGEVNVHLQNILRMQNLCNRSIVRLTRDSLMAIQNDLRSMTDQLTSSCFEAIGVKQIRDIYGARWEKDPKGFTFLEGEILCLLELAQFAQKRGVETFIKFGKAFKPQSVSPAVPAVPPIPVITSVPDEAQTDEVISALLSKIKRVYQYQFQTENIVDPEFDKFFKKLEDIKIDWHPTLAGRTKATITCPVCTSEGNDRRPITMRSGDPKGKWHIYNFIRHCDTFHYAMGRQSKRKQSYLEVEDMDEAMDDSVSDTAMTTTTDIKIEIGDAGCSTGVSSS